MPYDRPKEALELLKRWLKGQDERRNAGKAEDESAKARQNKTADDFLKNNIVGIVQRRLSEYGPLNTVPANSGSSSCFGGSQEPSQRIVKAIRSDVEAWLKTNIHPWESEMQ